MDAPSLQSMEGHIQTGMEVWVDNNNNNIVNCDIVHCDIINCDIVNCDIVNCDIVNCDVHTTNRSYVALRPYMYLAKT